MESAHHTIEPSATTLHGVFSRDLPPVLTIDSGDAVLFRTLPADWSLEPRRSVLFSEAPARFARPEGHDGHALCGPVFVRGAEPGMTLAVHIDSITPGRFGWTAVGGWPAEVNIRLGMEHEGSYLLWTLDPDAMMGVDQYGRRVRLAPFFGVMGLAPGEPGMHPTPPPRRTGGNLDCKELTSGSVLYLPIEAPGALFSAGDGHARQGDGEACVTAIECPIEAAELRFVLHEDMPLDLPVANTPAGWVALGLHEDLKEATYLALDGMLRLMERRFGLSRQDAYGLSSVLVDLRVTQIVNGVLGVHAVLPHDAIETAGLSAR